MASTSFNRVDAPYALMMISAKGGVGKSTMTVNLAAALTALGKRVGIFDADVHGPNIPALLGVHQRGRLTTERSPAAMFTVEARPDALDMRPLAPFERYGIRLMSMALLVGDDQPITPAADTSGQIVAMLMGRVNWGDIDVLLIDMPPGTGEPLDTFLRGGLVDGALLLTVRESLSHLDNGRLINLLNAKRVPVLGVVENMTHIICPNCGEPVPLYPALAADEAAYAGVEVLASVPFHPHMIRQNWRKPPLSEPDSPARAALQDLAQAVVARIDASASRRVVEDDDCENCP